MALVLGSSGALGSTVARHLSMNLGMKVLGADVVEIPSEFTGAWELDGFVQCPRESPLEHLCQHLVHGVHLFTQGQAQLSAIVCASGGWQGDAPSSADLSSFKAMQADAAAYAKRIQQMRAMNLDPVIAAGYVAQHYMTENGLMVVMGATAALSPTPGMLGYGLAKAASHHLVATLGSMSGRSADPKSTRKAGRQARTSPLMATLDVIGILPTTIDTPANRSAMPGADVSQWTKPLSIAEEISTWIQQPALRPHSGALVKVYPKKEGPGAVFELVR